MKAGWVLAGLARQEIGEKVKVNFPESLRRYILVHSPTGSKDAHCN